MDTAPRTHRTKKQGRRKLTPARMLARTYDQAVAGFASFGLRAEILTFTPSEEDAIGGLTNGPIEHLTALIETAEKLLYYSDNDQAWEALASALKGALKIARQLETAAGLRDDVVSAEVCS